MKGPRARFLLGAVGLEGFPRQPIPEVALAGRSNTGKSSLINALFNQRDLARTSSQPGRTRQVNLYDVDDGFRIVDLPGYGYGKISKEERLALQQLVLAYFATRRQLRGVVLLVDSRVPVQRSDQEMVGTLLNCGLRFLVAATKIDQLKRDPLRRLEPTLRSGLGIPAPIPILPCSAKKRTGLASIWSGIRDLIQAEPPAPY
jgi:GTP-binding protein